MAELSYYFDTATIKVEDNAGTPSEIPIGELRGIDVQITAEHAELYSADSILRSDVAKSQLSIEVSIDVAAFDIAMAKAVMAGDSTSTATSITDTTDVAQFTITGTATATDGTTNEVVVDGVYFEEFPAIFDGGTEGEYIEHNLSGTGRTISNLDTQ